MSSGVGQLPQIEQGLGRFMDENSDSMMGLGLGLMSGSSPQDAYRNAMTGYTHGAQQDVVRRKLVYAQQQELQKQAAAQQLVQKYNIPAGLATDPDTVFGLAKSIELQRRTPGPKPSFEERQFNLMNPEEQKQYRQRKFLGGDEETLTKQADQRKRIAGSLGWAPDDPRYESYVTTGKIPGQDGMTNIDKKEFYKAEDENVQVDSHIQALERAKALNATGNLYSGFGAGVTGEVVSKLPEWMVPGDKERAVKTSEFNRITSLEAITEMAKSLKGTTTDFELKAFQKVLADPDTDPKIKENILDRIIAKAKRQQQLNTARITGIPGGGYFKKQAGKGPAESAVQDKVYNPQTGEFE